MKTIKTDFTAFTEKLAEQEQLQINEFFSEFDLNFLLPQKDIKRFRKC